MIKLITRSAKETQAVGQLLGCAALPGDLILLTGELGSGKTCLVQGVASGLGIQEYVRSPTFVLIAEHRGRLPLYHIDLYRLNGIREVEDIGLDEYLEAEGLCAVEWADKVMPFFPNEYLLVELIHRGTRKRELNFTPRGDRYFALLDFIQQKLDSINLRVS